MTQSNVVVAIGSGAESLESARTWLTGFLAPMFRRPRGTFLCGGVIEYLRPVVV
jgi:hypothetical protein